MVSSLSSLHFYPLNVLLKDVCSAEIFVSVAQVGLAMHHVQVCTKLRAEAVYYK